ncbi:MAG TPA: DUF2851 family protein [Candidatus Marinimicrobia bacterium]|nr:DUF2851 family protein [Candidatus Neomarinimicrobiota bacterium]HRS51671.1 DUF2851 family protein [Candidatus Neomarinimicrobiota bacterium]HRU92179.1 DUF2851 family protein [Candidatus Neomarinimicrobiota bacterium]
MINCVPNRIAEPELAVTKKEKSLYKAWLNQEFNQTGLQTVEGNSLSILSPGTRNETEGPDFRDALIMLDEEFERGDIELHLEANDWYSHGHDRDPHYNNVVLHVVLNIGKTMPIKSCANRIIPTLMITPFAITAPEEFACLRWKYLSNNDFNQVLKTFAEIRFKRKAQIWRSLILTEGGEQAFYEGLADVMGYSRNRKMFGILSQKVPSELVHNVLKDTAPEQRIIVLESLLFGTAGFLTKPELKVFIRDTKYTEGLYKIWAKIAQKYQLAEMESADWHFAGSRPPNFPTLRIAALAQIINKFYPAHLAETWLRVIQNAKTYPDIQRWASEIFQQPDGLWRNHPLLKQQPGKMLIGTQRFNDLLSNLLLPFSWAVGSLNNQSELLEKTITFAEQVECLEMPGSVRIALNRLPLKTTTLRRNYLIQGIIEFTRRYCNLNICKLCPLEKYAQK